MCDVMVEVTNSEGAQDTRGCQFGKKSRIRIENMHTPVHGQNFLSSDDLEGENVYETYFRCVEDCAVFHIPTMVIHLPA